jgi:SAM-dependent methyltransferase
VSGIAGSLAVAPAPVADAAATPVQPDLAAAVRAIQNVCFSVYPPKLLKRMTGRAGPPPVDVGSDPRLQMKYLSAEEKATRGLFYPSFLDELLPAMQAAVRPGAGFLDLGSGDGRVVFLAAVLGARATGIEYDRSLHHLAGMALDRLAPLVPRERVTLKRGDFFREDWSRYDVVFYFGDGTYDERPMMDKLRRELPAGARLLLAHVTTIPDGFVEEALIGPVRVLRPEPR